MSDDKEKSAERQLDEIQRELGYFEKADKRYAAKYIERAALAFLALVGIAIATTFIKLIGL